MSFRHVNRFVLFGYSTLPPMAALNILSMAFCSSAELTWANVNLTHRVARSGRWRAIHTLDARRYGSGRESSMVAAADANEMDSPNRPALKRTFAASIDSRKMRRREP